MSSVYTIAAGMTLLAIALAIRHDEALAAVAWTGYWLGSFLVVTGTGKLLFLDER
jgi:uncharacterized membrane protein